LVTEAELRAEGRLNEELQGAASLAEDEIESLMKAPARPLGGRPEPDQDGNHVRFAPKAAGLPHCRKMMCHEQS
jgi:hypothetical protein